MNNLPKIVRERMRAAVATDHPDPDLLAAVAEQALPERERAPLLEHLARCADCRDVLALATAPVGSATTQTKDTAAVRKAPWFRLPALRWGALAAGFVIVGTAVLIHRDEKSAKFERDQSQLAVPKPSVGLEPSLPVSSPAAVPTSSQPSAPVPPTSETKALANKVELPAAVPPKTTREKAFTVSRNAPNQLAAQVPQPALPIHGSANAFVAGGLRDDRHVDAAHSAAGSAVDGPGLTSAPPLPGAKMPAPSVPGVATAKKVAPSPPPSANFDSYAPSQNEPVATMVDATSADSDKSDKKVEVMGRAKTAGAPASSAALAVAPDDTLDMQRGIAPAAEVAAKATKDRALYARSEVLRWNISSDGQLQRSVDSGKTWQPVVVAESTTFRALTFNGPDIWVGGAAGSLYHSPDAGAHWTQVKPIANGVSLSADVSAIAFTDPLHGKVTTTNGQTWTTNNGGQSWSQQP
jgi:hypothetical protein